MITSFRAFFAFCLLTIFINQASAASLLTAVAAKTETERLLAACREPGAVHCLDPFFDYDALSRAPLEAQRKLLGPARYDKIQKAFRSLLMLRARGASKGLAKGKLVPDSAKAETGGATIALEDAEEEVERRVTFFWQKLAGKARVVDVAIDGSSIIHDYKNQFARIVSKEGADGLVKRITQKASQAEKPHLP